MSADSTNLFKKLSRRWVGSIGAGGVADGTVTTIPLSSTTDLPTDTAVVATIDRVDANGTATPSLEETVIGVVSGDNLISCVRGAEGTAQAHSAGAVVEILVTAKGWNDMIDGFLAEHSQLGAHTWDGWMPAEETWTYSSWDSTVYTGVITVPSGAASKYSAGMRIKISQTTGGTKYGIITAVADTALTVFFGTDYTLNNETVSSPYYSTQKAPLGFPLSPSKWTVQLVNANSISQDSPTSGTWYNLGSLSLAIPIGSWRVCYSVLAGVQLSTGQTGIDVYASLSTSSSSVSDSNFTTYWGIIDSAAGAANYRCFFNLTREKELVLAAKATYYLIIETPSSAGVKLYYRGDFSNTIVKAICSYL